MPVRIVLLAMTNLVPPSGGSFPARTRPIRASAGASADSAPGTGQGGGSALHLDENAGRVVADQAGQLSPMGECVHERPEADTLHDALDAEPDAGGHGFILVGRGRNPRSRPVLGASRHSWPRQYVLVCR